MAEKLYEKQPEGVYHFFNRGVNKMQVFKNEEDIAMFYRIVNSAANNSESKIYHYAIMYNHFHILLYSRDIIKFGKHIMRTYSAYFNMKYKHKGQVFTSPFRFSLKNILPYQVECMQYILNNPVMAGLSKTPWGYKYSSLKCFNKRHSALDEMIKIDKSFTFNLYNNMYELKTALLQFLKHQKKMEKFKHFAEG